MFNDGFVDLSFHQKSFKEQAEAHEQFVIASGKIIAHPPEPLVLLLHAPAAKEIDRILAFSAEYTEQIVHEESNDYGQRVLNGLTIPAGMEMIDFTFTIRNCSRVFTHQMVRHRLASLTQSTSRNRVLPPVFVMPFYEDDLYFDKFKEWCKNSYLDYVRSIQCGVDPQDARYMLPDAIGQSMVFQVDFKSLQNICNQRMCLNMQTEMTYVAHRMKELVASSVGEKFGSFLKPTCDKIKKCLPIQCGVYNGCGKWPSDTKSKTNKFSPARLSKSENWSRLRTSFFKEK